jgi:hypothetical protein
MLGSVFSFFHKTFRNRAILVFALTAMGSGIMIPTYGQTVFNCSSFAGTGSCGVNGIGSSGQPFGIYGSTGSGAVPGLSGSAVDLVPVGSTHSGLALTYRTQVNVQAFSANFTFVPNQWNIALVLQNNTNCGGQGASGGCDDAFAAGAGCEGGWFQAFDSASPPWPNNIFALDLSSYNYTNIGDSSFTYSNAMIYSTGISPCIPNDNQSPYNPADKISTSPVPMNSPANAMNTTTGDTYSATITYDGSNVTLNFFDVTAGGSCPGASCFSHTWNNVNLPAQVGSNTAWLSLTGGTGNASTTDPLLVKSFTYTEGTSTTQDAAKPSFSPAAGTYSGAQSVALSSTTSGAVICYNTSGSPATNGSTGCASGTKYAGPVTVASNQTLYAVAGASGYQPSSMATASYVIQAPAATPPIFSPAVGTYSSAQNVTISDATSGATIYYTTNGTTPTTSSTKYTGTITVSSSETLKAIAVKSGYANSAVSSGTYTITSQPPAAIVSTPWFSMPAKTYTSAQMVSIYDTTAKKTIYYTTDGSTPTTSSTKYTGAINVNKTMTLKAMAAAPGDKNSAVASAKYTIKK